VITKAFCTVTVLVLISCSAVFGISIPEVGLSPVLSHTSVPPGEEFTITVVYTIPEKHHLTAHFFELFLDEQAGFDFGLQQVSSGQLYDGEIIRSGKAAIRVPVYVESQVTPGDYELEGRASYQICLEEPAYMCFPPADPTFKVTITISDAGVSAMVNPEARALEEMFPSAADEAIDTDSVSLEQRLQTALSDNIGFAFILVFALGFLTSLTPCVYPMIPITISYIGARSAGKSKYEGFFLSLFYVLGLALVYATLGVTAAATGALFGAITQTPLVLGFVALVFGVMGMSMLGLFDIQLPSSWQSALQSRGPKGGFLGAVIMGMVAGLVAAPCAGPVIVALMTFIASTGNVILGFMLMLGFALGMGILFVVLGTFSGLLTALPAAGIWMDKIKKVFGLIMIGAALFIAKPLLPPPIYGALIGLGLVILGAYMGAFKPLTTDASDGANILKAVALLLAVIGGYFVLSLIPVPGKIVPETMYVDTEQMPVQSIWRYDYEHALDEARELQKHIIIDFGAEWCVACKELESKTFVDPKVLERLNQMVAVKVDCTNARDSEVRKRLADHSISGLPTVIVLSPDAMELGRFSSFLSPQEFIKFLDQTISSDTIGTE
jgi:thioredoxin:protein disulfide reductase